VVPVRTGVFSNVAKFSLIKAYQRFGRTRCFYFYGSSKFLEIDGTSPARYTTRKVEDDKHFQKSTFRKFHTLQ
jgi:hypothetical protein